MHIVHEDGTEQEIGPGQAYVIEPGHDAWVVGDEGFVGFEFESRAGRSTPKAEVLPPPLRQAHGHVCEALERRRNLAWIPA